MQFLACQDIIVDMIFQWLEFLVEVQTEKVPQENEKVPQKTEKVPQKTEKYRKTVKYRINNEGYS